MADSSQPRSGDASERTPLLGSNQAGNNDETTDLGFDRADLKSESVIILTIASLVLSALCLVMLVLLEFAIGFSLDHPHQPSYPGPYYNAPLYAQTVACLALPALALAIINLTSIRRHGRTIPSAVNVVADGLIVAFVLTRALNNSELVTPDNLRRRCLIAPPSTPPPYPPYPPRPPPPPVYDLTCVHWVIPLTVFIWVFQVAAVAFCLVHVALFTTRVIRMNAARHLRPRASWLPASL